MRKRLLLLCAIAALPAANLVQGSAVKSVYLVAGIDTDGPGYFSTTYGPTFQAYLTETVGAQFDPPIAFETVPITALDIGELAQGAYDFSMLDGSTSSCLLRLAAGNVSALLTLTQFYSGVVSDVSGGVIFTLANRSDINTLQDLKGKVVSTGQPTFLQGFEIPALLLQNVNMSIYNDPAQLITTTSQAQIVHDVITRRISDVGCVQTGTLESLFDSGAIPREAVKIINPQVGYVDGVQFPYLLSSELYPRFPFMTHASVHSTVKYNVMTALLALNNSNPATKSGGYYKWSPPESYDGILYAQRAAGVLPLVGDVCSDYSDYYNLVICPTNMKPVSHAQFDTACDFCPESNVNNTYFCICNPCEAACGANQEEIGGTCVCQSGYAMVGGTCVMLGMLITVTVVPSVLIIAACIYFWLQYMLKRADLMWHVKAEELKFDDPAVVLGGGTFGVVLQAELRGSAVALKSLRTGTRPPIGGARLAAGDESGETTVTTRQNNRGIFPFIDTAYSLVTDTHRRGLLRLQRAFMQANRAVSEKEAACRKELAPVTRALHRTATVNATGTTGGTMQGRSTTNRNYSRFWKSRGEAARDEFIQEMRVLSKLRSPWTVTMVGAVLDPQCDPVLVMEYMDLGSLYSILHSRTLDVDSESMHMMILDIVQGCRFLHASEPAVVHGDLKSMNVLVDSRFRAKVADFGLSIKYKTCTGTPYWMAPELLRAERPSKASDVYAFGVVLYEIVTRRDPYEGEDFETVLKEVVQKKKRPAIPADAPSELATIMNECWHWDPQRRPTFLELERRLCHFDSLHSAKRNMKLNKGNNVVLSQVFPPHVAKALAEGQKLKPEHFDMVTIFFSDIQGFTDISKTLAPEKVCDMLDRLYTRFDILSEKHDIFKVETIGDAYMAVANLHAKQDNHAERIAMFALDCIKAAQATLIDETEPARGSVNIRVGFHTGPVVANVVGTKNPRYCLFGDTVNTASRMESSSEANRIHVSGAAHDELQRENTKLVLQSRGIVDIKGKGKMETFWVVDHHATGTSEGMNEHQMAEEVERRRSGRMATLAPGTSHHESTSHRESTHSFSARQSLTVHPMTSDSRKLSGLSITYSNNGSSLLPTDPIKVPVLEAHEEASPSDSFTISFAAATGSAVV